MVLELIPLTAVPCPPHYWLIEYLSVHTNRWTCQRCGVEQEHQDRPKLGNRWPNHRKPSTP